MYFCLDRLKRIIATYTFCIGRETTNQIQRCQKEAQHICLVSLKKGIEGLAAPSRIYGFLSAGKPVLAIISDDTDIVRILQEYNAGRSVCPGDMQGLKKLILEYANNRELVKSLGLNARKIYNDLHKREICTTKYFEMIKALIKNLGERVIVVFKGKILLITDGTGSFGNAMLRLFLDTDIKEIRIFSRDEKNKTICVNYIKMILLNFFLVMLETVRALKMPCIKLIMYFMLLH